MRLLFICMLFSGVAFTQVSDTVEISFFKSAYLIFDDVNFKYDVGSEDIIARKSDNKLILQAEVELFEETNLFVESGGNVYLFILKYSHNPKKYVYNLSEKVSFQKKETSELTEAKKDSPKSEETKPLFEISSAPEKQKALAKELYKETCDKVLTKPNRIFNMGVVKYKLKINLRDIVIVDDKMYFKFEMVNSGNIPYVFDYYKYKVVNVKRRVKGESFQLIELNPIYEHNRPTVIEGKSTINYVIVLDKFVLTENKKLRIEHWEDNGEDMNVEGGRKINFDVFSKDVLNVTKL